LPPESPASPETDRGLCAPPTFGDRRATESDAKASRERASLRCAENARRASRSCSQPIDGSTPRLVVRSPFDERESNAGFDDRAFGKQAR